jgi:hypothetical protein
MRKECSEASYNTIFIDKSVWLYYLVLAPPPPKRELPKFINVLAALDSVDSSFFSSFVSSGNIGSGSKFYNAHQFIN